MTRFLFLLVLVAGFAVVPSMVRGQTCTPQSAYLTGIADDDLNIWINGTLINSSPITFIGSTSSTAPPVYTFNPSILNTTGSNTIAAENINTTNSIVLSAWIIDITCSDGSHVVITDAGQSYKLYGDTTGTAPPPVNGGLQWYEPGWVDSGNLFSSTGTLVTLNSGYAAKNLWNPATGQPMQPISWNSTGNDNGDEAAILYYTSTFTLNEQTIHNTSFTITKSANPTSNVAWEQPVTYTLEVCNSGEPVPGPVTIIDNPAANMSINTFPSSGLYGSSVPFTFSTSLPLTMIYTTGFPGENPSTGSPACDTITYSLYSTDYPADCQILSNNVTLSALTTTGTPVSAHAGSSVTMSCPPTSTFTATPTRTNTNTPTATFTPTEKSTNTFTPTSTQTKSFTPSPTNTRTSTPTISSTNSPTATPTFTPTNTPTHTQTYTLTRTLTPMNTVTNTVSNTRTETATNTLTNTQTNSLTRTSTPTDTVTNSPTHTSSNTPTATPTNTVTSTPSRTSTNTSTNTSTATVTNTLSPTNTFPFSPTVTNTPTVTNSPTHTPNNTVTNSPTNTASNTSTATPTNTMTITPSRTSTDTRTTTNTFTVTNTATVADTATPTNTFQFSPTVTDTPTVTNSFTGTSTATVAYTFTPTFTATTTMTDTYSQTSTNTLTQTVTSTATNTATITNTSTSTKTYQFSPTVTNSATITNSFTLTDTATATNSLTITPTPTYSFTATNTRTNTNTTTATNSPTMTVTTTVTNTASLTHSPTATATITPNLASVVTMAKVASESQAMGGDTLTYAIGITVTGDAVNGLAVTDILPPNVSFVSFGAVPNGWPAPVYTASASQLSWTAPSPLAIGVYQLTYQTKVNSLIAGGTVISNHAVMSFPGGAPVTSVFNVQVVGQYTVSVNVYNSVGELVKQISVQEMTSSVNAITLSGNLITALTGTGSSVNIYYGDYYLGSWNGTTSSGTPVSNGTYYLKVDTVSSTGSVTSVTQPITVDHHYSQLIVNIYNSAGEVVKHLYAVVDNPQGIEMTNVALSSAVVTPGGNPSQSSNLQIMVETTTGSAVTLTWNGTGDNGSQVSSGVYELEAEWNDGAGGTEDITKEIVVQPGTDNNGMIVAEPNVLDQKNGTTITFVINSSQVFTMNFKIYTIAGELVRSTVKQSGPNWASYDSSPLASGLYLAEVEAVNSSNQVLQRQLLKFSVIH